MSFISTIARPVLACGFISEGVERVRNTEEVAPETGKALEPIIKLLPVSIDDRTLTQALGISEIAAGALISIGKFTKISGIVLANVSILNAIIDWNKFKTPASESENPRHLTLMKNLALIGGAFYASADRKGRPSHKWLAQQRKHEKMQTK